MNKTYEWLYDNYAKDLIDRIIAQETELVDVTLAPLSLTDDQKFALHDVLTDFRLHSGAEIFVLGLQLGLRLTAPRMGFKSNIVQ